MSDIAREAAKEIDAWCDDAECASHREAIVKSALDASTTEKDREIADLKAQLLDLEVNGWQTPAQTKAVAAENEALRTHLADCRKALEDCIASAKPYIEHGISCHYPPEPAAKCEVLEATSINARNILESLPEVKS